MITIQQKNEGRMKEKEFFFFFLIFGKLKIDFITILYNDNSYSSSTTTTTTTSIPLFGKLFLVLFFLILVLFSDWGVRVGRLNVSFWVMRSSNFSKYCRNYLC